MNTKMYEVEFKAKMYEDGIGLLKAKLYVEADNFEEACTAAKQFMKAPKNIQMTKCELKCDN